MRLVELISELHISGNKVLHEGLDHNHEELVKEQITFQAMINVMVFVLTAFSAPDNLKA